MNFLNSILHPIIKYIYHYYIINFINENIKKFEKYIIFIFYHNNKRKYFLLIVISMIKKS